jgi:hypothetical protein
VILEAPPVSVALQHLTQRAYVHIDRAVADAVELAASISNHFGAQTFGATLGRLLLFGPHQVMGVTSSGCSSWTQHANARIAGKLLARISPDCEAGCIVACHGTHVQLDEP